MTSEERREARYKRRQAKRAANRQKRCEQLGPVEKIFSYRDMFKYGKSAATVCAGSSPCKTLKCTCFLAQPNAAGRCWGRRGSR